MKIVQTGGNEICVTILSVRFLRHKMYIEIAIATYPAHLLNNGMNASLF